jgi:hypothetical protein
MGGLATLSRSLPDLPPDPAYLRERPGPHEDDDADVTEDGVTLHHRASRGEPDPLAAARGRAATTMSTTSFGELLRGE